MKIVDFSLNKIMKRISNKLIVVAVGIILVVGTGITFAFVNNKSATSSEKERSVAFVAGTEGKIWYIKAKDCSDEVYEYVDTKNIFDRMCRIYTTDGEFVYYNGMRRVEPFPVIDPVFVNGKFASSSVSSRPTSEPGPFVIEGADPETFEVISSDYLDKSLEPKKSPTLTYSRDKNFLYREGERVLGADPDTLLILGRGYIKDKNSVYYRGKKIDGSDGKTFEFLKYGYAHDKNFVYLVWQGKKIEGLNGDTFEILGSDGKYAKDSKSVYYNKEKIKGADSETFELMYDGNTVLTVSNGTYIGLVGYSKDKNTVYYKGEKIAGSDPDTFVFVTDGGRLYVKDKNFVYLYYGAKKLPWIDSMTFEHFFWNYFKDKNTVYFGNGKILTGADPKTFKVLGSIYIKDKNFVWRSYYRDEGGTIESVALIDGADPETFEFLEYGYAKNKNFVYVNGDALLGADADSIEVLSYRYLKDKNFVYLGKEKVEKVDPKTFEIIDSNYTKDKDAVYFRDKELVGITPDSFTVFGCGYLKDKLRVFFRNQDLKLIPITGADVDSFRTMDNKCYGVDKNSVYLASGSREGKTSYVKIEGANPDTFEIIDMWHAKDFTGVYYKGIQIKGADPATFEAINSIYAKDKDFAYYIEKKIPGADVKTFEVMQRGAYSKDSSFVYYKNVIIKGADPETFEVDRYGQIAKDKNTNYIDGKPITQKELVGRDIIIRPGFEKN